MDNACANPFAVDAPIRRPVKEARKTIFVGDGVPVFRERLEEELTVSYGWAADSVRYQKAASIASLGKSYMQRGKCRRRTNPQAGKRPGTGSYRNAIQFFYGKICHFRWMRAEIRLIMPFTK